MNRVCVDKGNSYDCECFNGYGEDDCDQPQQVCVFCLLLQGSGKILFVTIVKVEILLR